MFIRGFDSDHIGLASPGHSYKVATHETRGRQECAGCRLERFGPTGEGDGAATAQLLLLPPRAVKRESAATSILATRGPRRGGWAASLARLNRSLGVERGEERVFAWSAATLFLVGWASVSMTNVSETLFLKRVGVDRLPVVFLLNGLLLVGSTYLMSMLATRVRGRRLLAGTFAALGAIVLCLWLMLLAESRPVFVLLVIASKQLDAIALIAFWIVLGNLVHGRQAKRIYAPIIAGGTLGEILGSFSSGFIGNSLGVAALLPVSAGAILLACLLTTAMHAVAPARVTRGALPQRPEGRPRSLGMLRPLWRESRLFRLLAIGALLGGTLGPMLYFQFSYIVDMATRGSNGEIRLLDLYAKLRGAINLGVLGMQLVGTSRVFRRIGVPLASTISPLVYLLGFFGLSTRLDLPSGIGAMGGTNLQDHAIQEPAQRVLATLFPERVRPAATSLLVGPIQRTGGALGNVLVLGTLAVGTAATVGLVALPLAAIWLAVAVALWRIYPTLLLEVASAGALQGDVERSLRQLVDPGTMRALESSLVDPDPRRCRAACDLVIEAPWARAVAALAQTIGRASAANRPLIADTLHRLLQRLPQVRLALPELAHELEPLLLEPTALPARQRSHLVEAYARLLPSPRSDAAAARVLAQLLDDPAPAVRLAARAQRFGVGLAGDDLDAIVAAAFSSEDGAAREVGLDVARTALLTSSANGDAWQARAARVAARLAAPADRARAAEVLADIAVGHGSEALSYADALLAHAHDADARVRTAVLRFLGNARLPREVGWVIGRLASPDDGEAQAAAATLVALGPRVVSALIDALHREKRVVREAVFDILEDIPLNDRFLKAAMDREITRVRRLQLQLHGLRLGLVSNLVLQRLSERIAAALHVALRLLATRLREERIASLADLLARSPDGRARALLLEALEALLPPADAARFVPLLEDGQSPALANASAAELGRELPSFDEALRATLADRDRLTRTFLLATLDAPTLARLDRGGLASGAGLEHHRGPRQERQEDSMVKRVEIILHLRTLDLFAGLTTAELSELAGVVREETYPGGTAVVREGQFGDCMYMIVDGEVRVTREGKYVGHCGKGEFFGEMSIFDGEARFATVTAVDKVRLLRLERRDLLRLMDEQPGIAISICQTLSRHVRGLINRLEGRGDGEEGT